MIGTDGDVEAFCKASSISTYYNLSFSCTEGGKLDRWTSGERGGILYVEPVADEGYVFDGYYVDGARVEGDTFEFTKATKVEVRFVAE